MFGSTITSGSSSWTLEMLILGHFVIV